MKKIARLFIGLITILVIITTTTINVSATSYIYSHDNKPVHAAPGFNFSRLLTFRDIGLAPNQFSRPEDMYIFEQRIVYIVDSRANTLHVFDTSFNLITSINKFTANYDELVANNTKVDRVISKRMEIDSETGNEKLSNDPTTLEFDDDGNATYYLNEVSGVFRFENNIYLADMMNSQIVILDSEDYRIKQIITTPEDHLFKWPGKEGLPAKGEKSSNQVTFKPTKVVTDNVGRIYTISDEIYRGIIEIGQDGEFNRYTGVNYVTLSPWELFWRSLATEEQIARQETIINTTFTSLTVDHRGFIYATSRATEKDGVVTNDTEMIKYINPRSIDVLKRNGYNAPKGDVIYSQTARDQTLRGPSKFSAIAATDYGTYTVVDSKMGRLFTYDNEGYLLYISGEPGTLLDKINNPVAIKYLGDTLLVLDKENKSIMFFEPTPIGKIINEATYYYNQGEFDLSSEKWEEVVKLNSTYEYAYIGIGKARMKEEKYREAMEYFEYGNDRVNYSKAYKAYRNERIRKLAGPLVISALSLIVVVNGFRIYKKISKRNEDQHNGEVAAYE